MADSIEPPRRWDEEVPLEDPGMSGNHVAVAIETVNRPAAAWDEGSTGRPRKVYVKQWDGTSWVLLGGSALNLDASVSATYPSLDARGGNVLAAWIEGDEPSAGVPGGDKSVYVKRWDGTSWVQLGGALNTRKANAYVAPSVAIGPKGEAVVSWSEFDAGGSLYQVWVSSWDGKSWTKHGGALGHDSAGMSDPPSLVLDAGSDPIVAWVGYGSTSVVCVARWTPALMPWGPRAGT